MIESCTNQLHEFGREIFGIMLPIPSPGRSGFDRLVLYYWHLGGLTN